MNSSALVKHPPPHVSVIVTTFNRVELLSETIDSILRQDYLDFEIIIVDNMSHDDTEKYIASLEDLRIRYFRNPNYGVVAVNRNYGIERAKGGLIAFCDDDDLWLPEKLREQVVYMERHPNVALCYTNAESFIGERVIEKQRIRRCIRNHHFFQLLRGNYIPNSSVLIRSQVFQSLGQLTTDPTLREDYEMWLRIAKYYSLAGLDASLIRYRIHPNNTAHNRAAETLRSIRTVKSIVKILDVSTLVVQINITFQFFKYCFYSIVRQ